MATAVRGKKYADNPRFIIEELLKRRDRQCDIVWLQEYGYNYEVPKGVRLVKNTRNYLQLAYEYATAHIIIESAHTSLFFRKRKGQTFIQTWHGGLGIKKIEYDANNFKTNRWYAAEIKHTANCADVFISNSSHLSKIYRSAFKYKGAIFNCGYPKNDMLVSVNSNCKKQVRQQFNVPDEFAIVTYAPTFREYFYNCGNWDIDMSVYDLDYNLLVDALSKRFKKPCVVFIKMHPNIQKYVDLSGITSDQFIDLTAYNNMQELIVASDFFISDYSSCIFDAAIIGIPCFVFATDFERYVSDERGVYYEMEELPFPYAKNNEEMVSNILNFDENLYKQKWSKFTQRTGLNETGHAAKDIVDKICDVLDGTAVEWNNSDI